MEKNYLSTSISFIYRFFLLNIELVEHFDIDETFVFPHELKQLIIILYKDNDKNKRFPGAFALINNKIEAK